MLLPLYTNATTTICCWYQPRRRLISPCITTLEDASAHQAAAFVTHTSSNKFCAHILVNAQAFLEHSGVEASHKVIVAQSTHLNLISRATQHVSKTYHGDFHRFVAGGRRTLLLERQRKGWNDEQSHVRGCEIELCYDVSTLILERKIGIVCIGRMLITRL